MANSRRTKAAPAQLLFRKMGDVLKKTAAAMDKKRSTAAQLAELSERLGQLQPTIDKLDSNANSGWTDELSANACTAAAVLKAMGRQKLDVAQVRLEVLDGLISSSEGISQGLLDAASSLGSACRLADDEDEVERINSKIVPVQRQLKQLAEDIFATSFGMRNFSGLAPVEGMSLTTFDANCRCSPPADVICDPNAAADQLCLENGISNRLGGKGEDLREYISVLESDLRRLKDMLRLLAILLLWLAAQGYLTTNAGGPPCDDECSPSANVVGTTVKNVTAMGTWPSAC